MDGLKRMNRGSSIPNAANTKRKLVAPLHHFGSDDEASDLGLHPSETNQQTASNFANSCDGRWVIIHVQEGQLR